MNTKNLFCREVVLDSRELVIPRTTYQRTLPYIFYCLSNSNSFR